MNFYMCGLKSCTCREYIIKNNDAFTIKFIDKILVNS